MKLKIIVYFCLISLNLFAQPTSDHEFAEKRFAELSEKLKTDPDNYELIWLRIVLSNLGKTYIDRDNYPKRAYLHFRFYENSTELLNDLNKLIENNVVINHHNIAEFRLLRGNLYYFLGQTDKVMEDYQFALNFKSSEDNTHLNDNIYLSFAIYYYNIDAKLTEENARQTLKYINLLNPKKGCFSNKTPDCYEKEKVGLLKFLKENQQLIDFYKGLIFEEYESYITTAKSKFYIYNTNKLYFSTLKRIHILAEFYNEIQELEKSNYLTKQLVKYLPPDKNGQQYKSFPTAELYRIATEEYIKRDRNNSDNKKKYKELTWEYQDLTELIAEIKNE